MGKKEQFHLQNQKYERLLLCAALLIGIAVRLWQFGTVPGEINQDEAYAGYEAYSLLHYGMDSWGMRMPVYFISWGSGMNVLNSYLMLPFIALWGLKVWVIRVPQLIVACISLYVFYRLLLELFDRRMAMIGLCFFAICPWHICMARWGLESNLAPGFLLFGFYFFARGRKKSANYCWSALCYGLSLYCYATYWLLVPAVLGLQLLYYISCREFRFDRYTAAAVVILAVLAAPLILFLMVNWGWLPEIRTAFLTIPRMVVMRSDISAHNMVRNILHFLLMMLRQGDGQLWNSIRGYGLYYYISVPFALWGGVICLSRTIKSLRARSFDGYAFVLLPLIPTLCLCALYSVNVNRINCIHLFVVIYAVIGLYHAVQYLTAHRLKYGAVVLALVYCVHFIGFCGYYFGDYARAIRGSFYGGIGEATRYAAGLSEEAPVYYDDRMKYPVLLFYTQMPVEEWLDTVQWQNYPNAYLKAESFGRFHSFQDMDAIPGGAAIVIAGRDLLDDGTWMGCDAEYFGEYAVIYRGEN